MDFQKIGKQLEDGHIYLMEYIGLGLSSLKHTGLLDTKVSGDWHVRAAQMGFFF